MAGVPEAEHGGAGGSSDGGFCVWRGGSCRLPPGGLRVVCRVNRACVSAFCPVRGQILFCAAQILFSVPVIVLARASSHLCRACLL